MPAPVVEIPFELLGPGRRVTFTARMGPATARVRMELRCSDGRTATRLLNRTRPTAKIDLRDLGPARCTVALRNTGSVSASYYGAGPPGDHPPGPLTRAA